MHTNSRNICFGHLLRTSKDTTDLLSFPLGILTLGNLSHSLVPVLSVALPLLNSVYLRNNYKENVKVCKIRKIQALFNYPLKNSTILKELK